MNVNFWSWVARCSLALAATTIALLAGEGLVRVLGSAPAFKEMHLGSEACVYKRSTNPLLGFELKKDYRNSAPDLIQNYERTNAHGQRDLERTIAKPPGVRRILLLGDSVVEGYGLRQEETISHQLEMLLKQATVEEETEVLNFGVSAYCTRAEVELLEVKGLKFDPDIVVLVFVENDFDNFNREAFPLGGTMDRPALARWLFSRCHLFRVASLQMNLFQFGAEADPARWNQRAIGDNNVPAGLKRLRELADLHGFQPLIAIWPRFLNDQIVDVHFLPDSQSELIIERLAAAEGVASFRLSEFFRARLADLPDSTNPRLRFSAGDQLHPSPEGARIAAEAIHRYLVQRPAESLASGHERSSTQLNVAVQAARDLGADQPNYARVHTRVGTELFKAGKYPEAARQFQRALEEDPQDAAAHNNLGLALEHLGSDRAQEHFIRAVELQPDFAHAHFNLCRSLLRQGRHEAALVGLRRLVQIDPDHAGALRLLGKELGRRKRYDESRSYLERSVQIDPDDAEAHNDLGVVLAAQGELEEAITHFQAALKADPDHPRAPHNLHQTTKAMNHEE